MKCACGTEIRNSDDKCPTCGFIFDPMGPLVVRSGAVWEGSGDHIELEPKPPYSEVLNSHGLSAGKSASALLPPQPTRFAQGSKSDDWNMVSEDGSGMAAIQADIKRFNWEGLTWNAFWGLLAGAATTIFMSPDHSIKLGVEVCLILTTCATALTWMRGDGYTLISPKR